MYIALALQTTCNAVNLCESITHARSRIKHNIATIEQRINASKDFLGPQLKLVVLPEYFSTGYPMNESIEEWQKRACFHPEGEEYYQLTNIARNTKCYISGNCYELDDNFPSIYFQTSFIIDKDGNIILRYRKLVAMFCPSPYDVLNRYCELYGKDSLFPIVDTPLGRLGCIASEEIHFPEIHRTLTCAGAEVICHSGADINSSMTTPAHIAKLARCHENLSFLVSSNSAGVLGSSAPANSTDGNSTIINYLGQPMAQAGHGDSMAANAQIDVKSLRQYRKTAGKFNLLARQHFALFRETYNNDIYPENSLVQGDGSIAPNSKDEIRAMQTETIKHLQNIGVI